LNSAHEGYDYQDLLTSYFILKEILEGHFTSVFTIDKKNTSAGVLDKFDDLVITNGTEIQRKQIKYSNDSTSKTLKKDDLANDGGPGLAIHKLFETWKNLRTPETEFRLCLAWNEPTDYNIKHVLTIQDNNSSFDNYATKVFKINLDNIWETDPEKFNRWDVFSRYVREDLIDRSLFQTFCDELIIELELPKASLDFTNPSDLEKILIEQAKKLGIEQYPNDDIYVIDFLVRLAKLAGDYRSKSKEVPVQDILSDLRVRTDYGAIEQKFKIDNSKNIVISSKYQLFLRQIIDNRKSLLVGEPGAGKSWFLTNFITHLEENDSRVIRHYCFTSTEDDLYEDRITSNVFFGNLINSIVGYFPELIMEKTSLLTADLDELNLLLGKIDIPLVIIIDGLDHVERVLSNSTSLSQDKTRIIDYISRIVLPSNVSMILGSQPVDEVQTLIDDHSFMRLDLPSWDDSDTKLLMEKFSVDDIELDKKHLSTLLIQKSQGNPLYLTYILKSITNQLSISIDFIEDLPPYDFNLKSYYKYLSDQIVRNTTSEILACLEFSVTRTELKEISPVSHYLDIELKILSPILSENAARGGVTLYHDSFRRFTLEKMLPEGLNNIYRSIIKWLEEKGFYSNVKSYRYLLNYYIRSDRYEDVLGYMDNDFLVNSLYHGYPEKVIKNNFKNFLRVADALQDWSLFIYLGELNRTISTTNTEEHYSQFLENFELYFEAICLIHGTETANSLLSFNGEKNFNDEVTAKAFSILQKNGYLPRWDEVSSLFDDEIELENTKYYIYSLLQDEGKEELEAFFLSLVEDKDEKFIDEVIVALITMHQIDTIIELYQSITDDEDERVARRINYVLEVRNLPQRLNLENTANIQPFDNQPLSIDFINDHIDSSDLNKFYFNVSQYAKHDTEALIEFERTIPSLNFFHNWLKYFINIFIIECTVVKDKQEHEIVANLSFLASNVDYAKGIPRAMDIHYNNSALLELTIKKSLKHIKSKEYWKEVIEDIVKLPFPALAIVEKSFISEDNIHFIIEEYDRFGESTDSEYHEHMDYHFKKSIYYARSKQLEEAQEELRKAIKYLTAYTSRKDTTLSELIGPLAAINRIDSSVAIKYAKRLKYLNDAVMKHTEDGKGIKWLVISWYKELLNIDYLLANKYLINQLIEDPYFWKLDYMFVNLLEVNKDINPLILNFLYRLLPTNNRDEYLNGFLDVISSIKDTDTSLAKSSLINLLSRDWNDSYNTLEAKTEIWFKSIVNNFGLIYKADKERSRNTSTYSMNLNGGLIEFLNKKLDINDSIMHKPLEKIIEFYDKKSYLSDSDFNFIYFYLEEHNDGNTIKNLLLNLIRKRSPREASKYYEKIFSLIDRLQLNDLLKVTLFVNNFAYSTGGWLQRFINKESFKKAVEINLDLTLEELSHIISSAYPTNDYMAESTSNLLIAFEYASIDSKTIINMYERGYSFIESRLPDENDFKWEDVEDSLLTAMNQDELAIVLMLSKTKHQDSHIQREILVAISYLIAYDQTLLIKPLKWLLINSERFYQLSIASILELLLVEKEHCHQILTSIEVELLQASNIDNLYIKNTIIELLEDINNG
tara:strand:- start:1288 stop:6033 length:4746 start_codon:yes stop_codon:yes gene_type:complete